MTIYIVNQEPWVLYSQSGTLGSKEHQAERIRFAMYATTIVVEDLANLNEPVSRIDTEVTHNTQDGREIHVRSSTGFHGEEPNHAFVEKNLG